MEITINRKEVSCVKKTVGLLGKYETITSNVKMHANGTQMKKSHSSMGNSSILSPRVNSLEKCQMLFLVKKISHGMKTAIMTSIPSRIDFHLL